MTSSRVSVIIWFLSLYYYAHASPTFGFFSSSLPYTLYSRDDWKAVPSTDVRPFRTPVPYVVIHHTYLPAACYTTEDCSAKMLSMQRYHNSLDWGDIGYNFCVGTEGGAYEGRGWDTVGIHTGKANNYSIGICLIGDWRVNLPPPTQLETTRALIAEGVKLGKVCPDYKLIAHKQVMPTECPGEALFGEISTWNNFEPGTPDFNKIAASTTEQQCGTQSFDLYSMLMRLIFDR